MHTKYVAELKQSKLGTTSITNTGQVLRSNPLERDWSNKVSILNQPAQNQGMNTDRMKTLIRPLHSLLANKHQSITSADITLLTNSMILQ